MWPQTIDKRTHQLLRKVAGGRHGTSGESSLLLDFQQRGGDGLFFSVCLEQQRFSFWMDEFQWCSWIKPVLVVPTWDNVPESLLAALASWTLAPIHSYFELAKLDAPIGESVRRGSIGIDWGWVLTLEHEGRTLALRCVDAPFDWLEGLVSVLTPLDGEGISDDQRFPFPLVVGWCSLSYRELSCLQRGDGITLQNTTNVAHGQVWLFQGRPLAKLEIQEEGACTVDETALPDFDDWLDVTPMAATPDIVDDALLTVVAQIGVVELPLRALGQIRPGQEFNAPMQCDTRVRLTVNGRTLGYGTLLDVDGCLVVRVERLGG